MSENKVLRLYVKDEKLFVEPLVEHINVASSDEIYESKLRYGYLELAGFFMMSSLEEIDYDISVVEFFEKPRGLVRESDFFDDGIREFSFKRYDGDPDFSGDNIIYYLSGSTRGYPLDECEVDPNILIKMRKNL